MDIAEIQEHARQLSAAQGWTTTPEARVSYLRSEVDEMALEVHWLLLAHDEDNAASVREALGMEIYDVVWNLCDLANTLGLDLEAAFRKKADQNRIRRW